MNAEILLEDFFVHTIIPPDRTIDTGLALKEIGYLDAVRVRKELTYSDMLEITIRLASQEGVAVDYLDGVRYETPFPHVLIKKPGVHHAYAAELSRKAFFLQYRPESVAVMEKAGVCFEPLIWRISLTETLSELINRLLQISALLHLPLIREKADALGWELFLELLEFRSQKVCDDDMFRKLQKIASYLQVHFLESPNIRKLAQTYGLSERSFCRHWKNYYPQSPAAMIGRLKLEYAKNCLTYTDMPVSAIAAKLNCSTIYFNRMFKRETEKTPLHYRRSSRLANE